MRSNRRRPNAHLASAPTSTRRALSLTLALTLLASLLALTHPGHALAATEGTITEFSAGLSVGSLPGGVAPGPDGNLWFTLEGSTAGLGRITPQGTITEFTSGLSAGSEPYGVTAGPDGDLWFTDRGPTPAIGRVTPSGAITEFTSGLSAGSEPSEIVLGPDGNLWFTDRGTTPAIGRVTPSGAITEFTAGLGVYAEPLAISAGPDGNLWFTVPGRTAAIGQITPSGTITEFKAGLPKHSEPWSIAAGADGNLWFTDHRLDAIGQITPNGTVTEYTNGLNPESLPSWIAAGPDGDLWFTDLGVTRAIGRVAPNGAIAEFTTGLGSEAGPVTIAPGADGGMWFADQGKGLMPALGRIETGAAAALTSAPTIAGSGVAGTAQLCAASWSTWASQPPSLGLFAFDGYRWLLEGVEVGSSQSYTPTAAQAGHRLACRATATYPSLNVTSVGESASIAILPAPSTLTVSTLAAPLITSFTQSADTWREEGRPARLARKRRPPIGTVFSFTANEQLAVSLHFARELAGREIGGKCLRERKKSARGRHCTRALVAGSLSLTGQSGANHVRFTGRISPKRRLKPGRYSVTIVATNAAGKHAQPRSLSFQIVG